MLHMNPRELERHAYITRDPAHALIAEYADLFDKADRIESAKHHIAEARAGFPKVDSLEDLIEDMTAQAASAEKLAALASDQAREITTWVDDLTQRQTELTSGKEIGWAQLDMALAELGEL